MAGRKSTAFMELAIGATIIAGVVILVVMLMMWGNSLSILGSHYRVAVNMSNVGGLKEGAPVKMGGFQIGRVASIQIRPGSTEMELVLDIDDRRDLPGDSIARVATAGLVGDAFMEIVPGKSTKMLAKARNAAEAQRIESSPPPDMSELMAKVNSFGDQLNILTTNLNDIVGDARFRGSIKSMAANLDSATYQTNEILQRSRSVIDRIDAAARNAADLSVTLKDSVGKASADITRITGSADELLAAVKDRAAGAIDNLNAGIADVRNAVNATLGNPDVAKNLAGAVANINSVTALLAKRNDATEKLLLNLGEMAEDLKAVSARVKAISEGVDPDTVSAAVTSLNSAIGSMTDVVDKVKAEPVLALSINKAADRIVKMKFDEMAKRQIRDADSVLDEVSRWVKSSMDRGVFEDPAFSYEVRPYVLPESASQQITGDTAVERQPYIIE